MPESLLINAENKKEKYSQLLPQLKALIGEETDLVACMANISAALYSAMKFFWVGFYIVREDWLVLGPFQGPVACTRISKGRGVCGTAWEKQSVILVPDVNRFPGHIACSSESRSEIVLPVFDADRKVIAVLDVDSEQLNNFDEDDSFFLEKVTALLVGKR